MTSVPTSAPSGEEWPDAEFDFLDEEPIQASDAESDEEDDWDIEMDLGTTGGGKAHAQLEDMAARCVAARSPSSSDQHTRMVTIRPPINSSWNDDDDDSEGISTIKVSALPKGQPSEPPTSTIDEDFEDDLVIPSDVTELSLCPTPLAHRCSKSSMEWGERDNTTSSQSSDTFSTFGFTDNSTPSSATSASLPDTETEDEEEEDVLDGLVVPSGLFESGHSAKRLNKLLESKKAAPPPVQIEASSPNHEEDFEAGLVLEDDAELSPSRLKLKATQAQSSAAASGPRSKSMPPRTPVPIRPPSRLRNDKERTSTHPPVSSLQQFRKLPAPLSLQPQSSSSRQQTYGQALAAASTPSSSANMLSPKFGALRGQKSHTGLKPPSPSTTRRLTRKASLPALESSTPQASSSGSCVASTSRYEAHTTSSRAKMHTHSTSRISGFDYNVPPTRPSTPSSNPVAIRLTMPTSSSRLKARAPLSAVFPQSATMASGPSAPRSDSPLPPAQSSSSSITYNRPTSASSARAVNQASPVPSIPAPKVLKRPKRLKTYGDGTELDGIEDLPLDREKEGRYRVQPKGYVNRIPGASYMQKDETNLNAVLGNKTSYRKATKHEPGGNSSDTATTSKILKRTGRLGSITSHPAAGLEMKKRKKSASSTGQTKRKPTLIRNLGGTAAPKVVGEMKWNPQTLRWEGNDQILRDFDAAVGTSVRPALITQLTGSSIGSPIGNVSSGARVVGNMLFDPARMCWISTLPPEEDEPDVFADLADDEDDEWEAKGATIRSGQQSHGDEDMAQEYPLSRTRSMSISETESDRCSRGSLVYDVEDGFVDKCRLAEERHRIEMKGWIPSRGRSSTPDRAFLYEIRALATRQY